MELKSIPGLKSVPSTVKLNLPPGGQWEMGEGTVWYQRHVHFKYYFAFSPKRSDVVFSFAPFGKQQTKELLSFNRWRDPQSVSALRVPLLNCQGLYRVRLCLIGAPYWTQKRFCLVCSTLKWKVLVSQLSVILCDPMDYSPPSSSVHGVLQARILTWVAMPSSGGSSWPRDQTQVSCIAGRFFTVWATMSHRTLKKK